MKVISVVGHSDSGKTTVVERLTEVLASRGTVGTVKHVACEPDIDTEGKDTARHRNAGAVRTYGIADDGWFATGDTLALDDALGRLAETCDYAIVEGYTDAALPTVVLGDRSVENGTVLTQAETGDQVDVDAVLDALADVEPYETLPSLVARVKRSPDADKAGAIATFTGRVRTREHEDDDPTEYLEFEKYDGIADEKMDQIREELESRAGVYEVRLHHRTGVVESGEDIVFVVVLAGHRTEAFETVEDGINRLKDEVPLFKKEVTVDEEFWAHEA